MKVDDLINRLSSIGMLREIDNLGRVVIPIEYRRNILKNNDAVYLQFHDEYVIISTEEISNIGIKKKIDNLGRILPPKELRKKYGWYKGDSISIWAIQDYIILKKTENSCIFCKSTKNLIEYKNKKICINCKNDMEKIK